MCPGRCRRGGCPRSAGRSRGCRRRSGRSSCRAPGRAATCRCRRSPSRWGSRARWRTPRTRPGGQRPAGPPPATARGRTPPHRSRSRRRGRRPARAGSPARAERVEVEVLEQLVERAVVVARVVDDPERRLERELLLGDEVLPPQLEPVHAELVGEPVHHQLDPVGGLRPARAADRVRGTSCS